MMVPRSDEFRGSAAVGRFSQPTPEKMVGGYNHNVSYRGSIYHVQTEDGGVRSPTITTHLYSGGGILASRKLSYADIIRVDNLPQVVEELMKEQHKGMLRSLKNGEFDAVLAERHGAADGGS